MTDGKTQEPTKNELALHHSSISLFARNLIYQRNMSAECGGTVDVVRQGCGVMLRELTQLKLS